jgi:hypothetical protein
MNLSPFIGQGDGGSDTDSEAGKNRRGTSGICCGCEFIGGGSMEGIGKHGDNEMCTRAPTHFVIDGTKANH